MGPTNSLDSIGRIFLSKTDIHALVTIVFHKYSNLSQRGGTGILEFDKSSILVPDSGTYSTGLGSFG